MRNILLISILISCFFVTGAQQLNVLLITGGHSYDTTQFFETFDSFEDISYEHLQQPQANQSIAKGKAQNFDVLVFYDMWRTISDEEKQAYIDLAQKGTPLLFMHHSLVSYQDWAEFEKIIGGKYIQDKSLLKEQQSTYKHDVWVDVKVANLNHPATKKLNEFKIFDEVYENFKVQPDIKPLLTTDHPESNPIIAWENRYENSKIIYIQLGHGHDAYENENFRKLLIQTIKYLVD